MIPLIDPLNGTEQPGTSHYVEFRNVPARRSIDPF